MSLDDASSAVTYMSISSYSNGPSWGIPVMDVGELPEMDPCEEAAQQGQTVPPSSPAYVPDPEKLEHHIPVYVLEPIYSEYLAPSDDDIPVEDQPLPADASLVALSPGYVADSDLEEDHADYPGNGEEDDDDDDDHDNDDDDEEDEHLAPADSSDVPIVDPVLSAEETEAFETDESAPTPPSPKCHMAMIFIPSPPLPLPSPPTHTSPTYAEAPLGYKAIGIWLRVASPLPLPAPSSPLIQPAIGHREDFLEADVPPRKRLCLTALTSSIRGAERRVMAAVKLVNLRVVTRLMFVDGRARSSIRNIRMYKMIVLPYVMRGTLRRYLSSLCTTHDQERVKSRQALDSSVRTPMIMRLEPSCVSRHWRLENALILWRTLKMPPKRNVATTTTTPMTDAQIKALITQGVADALAECDAYRSRNGDDSYDSRSGERRQMPNTHECTYS
nr:hypothetical protein [Tanacetum cinerariifolium]